MQTGQEPAPRIGSARYEPESRESARHSICNMKKRPVAKPASTFLNVIHLPDYGSTAPSPPISRRSLCHRPRVGRGVGVTRRDVGYVQSVPGVGDTLGVGVTFGVGDGVGVGCSDCW